MDDDDDDDDVMLSRCGSVAKWKCHALASEFTSTTSQCSGAERQSIWRSGIW